MADDKLKDILNELRLRATPALLAFMPDEENQNIMLRNLPAAVLIKDSSYAIILEANDYALELFGVERKLLIGSTLSDLCGYPMVSTSDSRTGLPSRQSMIIAGSSSTE